jgi:hypothetical protein
MLKVIVAQYVVEKPNQKQILNPMDKVNHPSHYTWLKDLCGIEVIDITRHMDFDLGNAIKYILRSGHKSENGYTDKGKAIEDLEKAIWYIQDEIMLLLKEYVKQKAVEENGSTIKEEDS